jgi:hypothetical protein
MLIITMHLLVLTNCNSKYQQWHRCVRSVLRGRRRCAICTSGLRHWRIRSRLTVGVWQVTVEILRSSFEGEDTWMATGDWTQCSVSGHIDLCIQSTRVVPSEVVQRLFRGGVYK